MTKILKNLNQRLQTLENRREILIELNKIKSFSQSGHPRTAKYFNVLNDIRNQKGDLYRLMRIEENKSWLTNTKGLNGSQILILNNRS